MPIKKYYLKEKLSDEAVQKLEGSFIDKKASDLLITDDADVYRIDSEGNQHILFYFRKKIIADSYLKVALSTFKSEAVKASSIRGKAAGYVDTKKLAGTIVGVVNPNSFKSRVIYQDGHVSDYYMSNKVNSLIAGYFDKPKISEKSEVLKQHRIPCRMTAFTEQHLAEWKRVLPLVDQIDQLYSEYAPEVYQKQRSLADRVPQYVISGTAFSTVTVNYNWRTAVHIDSGDMKDGLSAIIVATEGQYTGGYLGYPQFGVWVDIRHGDFLLKDPHQYHCNTAIIPVSTLKRAEPKQPTRLSMIFYYRENIQKCGTSHSMSKVKQSGGGNQQPPKVKAVPCRKAKELFTSPLPGVASPTMECVTVKAKNSDQILDLAIRPETTDIKVIDEVLVRDVYEKKKLNFAIEAGECWLDLGGNIGTFTLLCLVRGASVIAYEPEEDNFTLLKENVEANFPMLPAVSALKQRKSSSPQLTLVKSAVGIQDGQIDLYLCKGDYNKYRHTIYPKRGRSTVQVPIESIWSVFTRFPMITAVKIDIEGAEIDILENLELSDWRSTRIDKLVFEYSFDIDKYIPRFLKIVSKLRQYFDVVEYTKVKEDEEYYNYFPAATMVYCLKTKG